MDRRDSGDINRAARVIAGWTKTYLCPDHVFIVAGIVELRHIVAIELARKIRMILGTCIRKQLFQS